MLVKAHVAFDGRAEEALGFYSKTLNGKIENMLRYEDAKEEYAGIDLEKSKGRIMNACLKFKDSMIGICDIPVDSKNTVGDNVMLDIVLHDGDEIKRIYNALSEGGQIKMPLSTTFFSPNYGMIVDKFGIHWNFMQMP